ncbi:hypothetical protein [Corynebacterium sp.]|uniref:hypothetical protein n=1 Tax=Corynebacterium sp. TaxID=1720 RepID=UPI0037357FD6
MALLSISVDRVTVTLRWWEKIAARRSHLTIPLRVIRGVSCVDDARAALGEGERTSATHIRGLTYSGTMNRGGKPVLGICHRVGPGIVLELEDATYGAIVISTPHAEKYAEMLASRVA